MPLELSLAPHQQWCEGAMYDGKHQQVGSPERSNKKKCSMLGRPSLPLTPLCVVTFFVTFLSLSVHCGATIRRSGQLTLNSNEYKLYGGFADDKYLYYVACPTPGYGKMIRINPTTLTRSTTITGTQTVNWYCVAQSGDYAYIGTWETNAHVIRISLSSMTALSMVTLTGCNYASTVQIIGSYAYLGTNEANAHVAAVQIGYPTFTVAQIVSVNSSYCQYIFSSQQYGGFVVFTCSMQPGRLMRFNYTSMSYAGSVAGNTGDDYFRGIAIIGSTAYVACATTPGRIVSFDLATMSYGAMVAGQAGEDDFRSIFVNSFTLYVSTDTSPSFIVQFDPSTMTRVLSVSGDPQSDWSLTAPLQFGSSVYYATLSSSLNPGRVTRFQLNATPTSTMSLSSEISLSHPTESGSKSSTATVTRSHGSDSESASRILSLSTSRTPSQTPSIARLRLPKTNMHEHGQLMLNSNEYTFQSSVTDGTYLYFIANTDSSSGYGKMVRINPTTFTRSASVTGSSTGTNNWYCVAQSGGYAYVGTYETVANLHQIALSTMTVVSTINLNSIVTSTGSGFNYVSTVQIVGSYAYFATYESSPSIVRIAIPGFTYSTYTTISSSYCQRITSSGQYGGYLFFTCNMAPGRLMRFDYTNMAYSTYVSGNYDDNYFIAMTISGSVAYVACSTAPGRLVQFNLATMTYGSVVSGAASENYFISVYVSGAFVYVTTGTSPSRIVRFYATTMVRLFAVSGNPLNDWSLTAPAAFGAYVYYGTSSSSINPGVISRFNFGATNSPSASPSLSSDVTLSLSRGTPTISCSRYISISTTTTSSPGESDSESSSHTLSDVKTLSISTTASLERDFQRQRSVNEVN